MKVILVYIVFLFSFSTSIGQHFNPSEEEQEKYTPYLMPLFENGHIKRDGSVSNYGLKILDSLYYTDSSSLFLKGLLIQTNLDLIYNSLRTDRINQCISIINSFTSENRSPNYYTLAPLNRYLGNFKTAISYYNIELSSPDIDSQARDLILNNLIGTYLDANENKKAYETMLQLKSINDIDVPNSMFAKVYYRNNKLDSALIYADKALQEEKKDYSIYTTRAKILKAKGKTDGICTLVQQAMALIEEQKLEQMLEQRDKTNPFIQLQIKDIDETKQLKKEYCN